MSAIDGTLDGVAVRAPTLDIAVRDDRQLSEPARCGSSFHLPLQVGEQKSVQSRFAPGAACNPREFAKGHDVGRRETRCGAALEKALRLLGALRGWDRCVVNAPVWVIWNASPQARCAVVGLKLGFFRFGFNSGGGEPASRSTRAGCGGAACAGRTPPEGARADTAAL